MIEAKHTNTSVFLVPALTIGKEKLERNGFIDGFLDDISHEIHYENSIYILFKPHDLEVFQHFLASERERITILDDYDYEEYVVVVYNIPTKYLSDYQLFLEGKYSKLSEDFKNLFTKTSEEGRPTLQWEVFERTERLKSYWEKELDITLEEDQELWGAPDMSKEILDIEQIKKNAE